MLELYHQCINLLYDVREWPPPIQIPIPISGFKRVKTWEKNTNAIIKGGRGSDCLEGNVGNDRLYGRGGHDVLIGGEGYDRLHGQGGNDILTGVDANSETPGFLEVDRLWGGRGRDIFVVADAENGNYYVGGNDSDLAIIQDFNLRQDRLQLRGSSRNYYTREEQRSGRISVLDTAIYLQGSDDLIAILEDTTSSRSTRSVLPGEAINLDKISFFV